jgi:UDP-N-acetylmuramate dehydrogenase
MIFHELHQQIPGLEEDVSLAAYTTWQVGGPARFFVQVSSRDAFVQAVCVALTHDLPFYILGLGSNVLFSDDGFDGLVIRNASVDMEVVGDTLLVDAGAPLARVATFASKHRLTGIEFGLGIPGTIGGGVVGNAGMKSFELKNVVSQIWVVELREGVCGVHEMSNAELAFGYRHSALKIDPRPVVRIELQLKQGDPAAISATMREWALHRTDRQPIGEKCAGSTFKNPEGDSAGRLIEAAGLKEHRIGGAYISSKHANFFINDGTATAKDVHDLMMFAQQTVRDKFGVELETEVRVVGFSA